MHTIKQSQPAFRVVGLLSTAVLSTTLGLSVIVAGAGENGGKPMELCKGVGLQPFVDVTVPFGATVGEGVAVLYSFVPWAVAVGLIVGSFRHRTSTMLSGLFYVAFMVGINESLVKRNFPQARPTASCLISPGMPSSHSLLSIGLLSWFLLELTHNRRFRSWWSIGALLLLAPVPPSRVVLNDHSVEQATAGSLLGLASALTFFAFMRRHLAPNLDSICGHRYAKWLGIVDDYSVFIN